MREHCKRKGFVFVKESGKNVYIIDKDGFNHKADKSRFIRNWVCNLQSVSEDDKDGYFLKMLLEKHPDIIQKSSFNNFKYYSATRYTRATCLKHGDYKTKPNWLLNNGHHCSICGVIRCAKSNTKDTNYFIKKAELAHNDRYLYDKTKYEGTSKPLTVTCKEHGDFDIVAGYHLQGCGCQICGLENGGYSRTNYSKACPRGSNVYVMVFSKDSETFLKVGISKSPKIRGRTIENKGGYLLISTYKEFFTDAGVAWDVEKLLLKEFKNSSYVPNNYFEGSTECFDLSIKDEVIKLLQSVA